MDETPINEPIRWHVAQFSVKNLQETIGRALQDGDRQNRLYLTILAMCRSMPPKTC